jgi:hypothetical protein
VLRAPDKERLKFSLLHVQQGRFWKPIRDRMSFRLTIVGSAAIMKVCFLREILIFPFDNRYLREGATAPGPYGWAGLC